MKPTVDISFKIPGKLFWFITIMILLLPITTQYRLLIWGEYTRGVVIGAESSRPALMNSFGPDKYPVIQFKTGDNQTIRLLGPENFKYPIGEELKVVYNPKNPNDNAILSIGAFYASKRSILPGILFIVWMAFYLAFKTKN